MNMRHLRQALIAAAALTTLPALADTTLPGTLCVSEGAAERSVNGLMVNKATTLAKATHFHCPIMRTQPVSLYGGTLSVTVNVKTNPSNVEFNCYVRAVAANNVVVDTSKLVFASSGSNNGYAITTGSVTLPPSMHAVVNMRCSVPNVTGGDEAGIVSYRIEQ